MVRTKLDIGCRYSTPVCGRSPHPAAGHFTHPPSQTQAPVTLATEPERRAGGSLTLGKSCIESCRAWRAWSQPKGALDMKYLALVLATFLVLAAAHSVEAGSCGRDSNLCSEL